MRIVCGLDVHKDSIFLCIMSSTGEIFEKKYGVLTNQLEEMRDLMLMYHVQEVGMESTGLPTCYLDEFEPFLEYLIFTRQTRIKGVLSALLFHCDFYTLLTNPDYYDGALLGRERNVAIY